MRIMLDTNVLISAILFRSESLNRLIVKVAEEYTLVLSTYVVDELKNPPLYHQGYLIEI